MVLKPAYGAVSASLEDYTPSQLYTITKSYPGGPNFGSYISGQIYALTSSRNNGSFLTNAIAAGTCNLYPFTANETFTPAGLGPVVTTGVGGTTVKTLIYQCDADGWPDVPLFLGAPISSAVSSTHAVDTASMPTFVAGTTYWLGTLSDGGTPTLRTTGAVAIDNLRGRMATAVASVMSTNVQRTGMTYAAPNNPWGFAASQLTAVATPLIFAVM